MVVSDAVKRSYPRTFASGGRHPFGEEMVHVLCVPVIDEEGNVVAVIEAVNCQRERYTTVVDAHDDVILTDDALAGDISGE